MRSVFLIFILVLSFVFSCSSEEPDDKKSSILGNSHPDNDSKAADESIVHSEDSQGRKTEKSYYPTGEIEQIIVYNESGIGFIYLEYWENGNYKIIGEQGNLAGCAIAVGDEQHFDESENLIHKITYDHFLPDPESCHQIRTLKTFIDYHPDGNLEKSGKIETCYECEECPCGKWIYYDEVGNLISTENFGNCYDSQLDCFD